jgi:hypothetical protein
MKDKIILVLAALIFIGIVSGGSFYKGFKTGQDDRQADWDAAMVATAKDVADQNKTTVESRKKAKHATINRNRDERIRYGCQRGWVRDIENCPK